MALDSVQDNLEREEYERRESGRESQHLKAENRFLNRVIELLKVAGHVDEETLSAARKLASSFKD